MCQKQEEKNLARVREALNGEIPMAFQGMVGKLMSEGHEPALIASAAMQLCFSRAEEGLTDIAFERKSEGGRLYRKLIIGIGRRQKAAPNHIVSAVAGRANIRGTEIGKIEIYDEKSVVGVPAQQAEAIARAMQGATICGIPVRVKLSSEKPAARPAPGRARREEPTFREERRAHREAVERAPHSRQGKVRLSHAACARLLDTGDLSRFELSATGEKPRHSHADRRRDGHSGDRRGSRKKPERGSGRRTRR